MIWVLDVMVSSFGMFSATGFGRRFRRLASGTAPYAALTAMMLAIHSFVPAAGFDGRSAKADTLKDISAELPKGMPIRMAVQKVTDGDSIRAYLPSGAVVRLRLHGIDAPEMRQSCADASGQPYPCGQVAQVRMAQLAPSGGALFCTHLDTDRYKRLVVRCVRDGQDIAETLVKEGLALAYRRYDDAYIPAEDTARRHKRGLWAGTFLAPWDWRRVN